MATVSLPAIRLILYAAWFLFTTITFFLCIARLVYTLHRRDDNSLFNGNPFVDPSILELLITCLFSFVFIPLLVLVIKKRAENDVIARVWFELAGTAILWLLWLGGTAAATNVWPNLTWCVHPQCALLQAIIALAWLGWICITALLIGGFVFGFKTKNWTEPTCDSWGAAPSGREAIRKSRIAWAVKPLPSPKFEMTSVHSDVESLGYRF